jgi:hypothetical protein
MGVWVYGTVMCEQSDQQISIESFKQTWYGIWHKLTMSRQAVTAFLEVVLVKTAGQRADQGPLECGFVVLGGPGICGIGKHGRVFNKKRHSQ